jgi:uncharacterized protein YndB with AHSA1/START domain
MIKDIKTMELKLERTIPASPAEVYDAWLDPQNPGSAWHDVDKLILQPKIDGLFYRMHLRDGEELPHFGRFTALEKPKRIVHTWMSWFTHGLETTVTVTFDPKGRDTLLTLRHAGLPDDERGRAHHGGWTHYLGRLLERFEKVRS